MPSGSSSKGGRQLNFPVDRSRDFAGLAEGPGRVAMRSTLKVVCRSSAGDNRRVFRSEIIRHGMSSRFPASSAALRSRSSLNPYAPAMRHTRHCAAVSPVCSSQCWQPRA